ELVASAINTPAWATIRRSDVHAFWKSLPEHIQTDFAPKDSASKERMWLEEDQQFVLRALDVQLEGDIWAPPTSGLFADYMDIQRPSSGFIHAVQYYRNARRDHDSRFAALAEFSPRVVPLYAWTLARFHDVDLGLTSEGR